VIAQEIETVFPELVSSDSNGYKSVSYEKISAVLVEAIKEQQAQISNLSNENKELKARLSKFEKMQAQIDYLQSLVGSLVKEN
jgi:uncharacterized protein YlxW (UPF0749 family)